MPPKNIAYFSNHLHKGMPCVCIFVRLLSVFMCNRQFIQKHFRWACSPYVCLVLLLPDIASSEVHDKKNNNNNLLRKIVLFITMRISIVIIEDIFLYQCLDAHRKLPVCFINVFFIIKQPPVSANGSP